MGFTASSGEGYYNPNSNILNVKIIGCTFHGNSQRTLLEYQGRGSLTLRDNCFFGNDGGTLTEPIRILLPDSAYNGTNATYYNSSNTTNSTSPAYYEINDLDLIDIQSSRNYLINGIDSNVVIGPDGHPCGVYVYYYSQIFTASFETPKPSCMTYFEAIHEQDDESKSICPR